jgi:conjugal transfer pilus assembly protein TraV
MKITMLILSLVFILTGCSTVNSSFSCNKTAGDTCLTIEQVDAMTAYADDPMMSKPSIHQKQGVWIVPKRGERANHVQ